MRDLSHKKSMISPLCGFAKRGANFSISGVAIGPMTERTEPILICSATELFRPDTHVLPELFRGKFIFRILLRENVREENADKER